MINTGSGAAMQVQTFNSNGQEDQESQPLQRNNEAQGNSNLRHFISPSSRFCHVGEVMRNRLYIFGGYDGVQRLNDFYYFTLPNESGEFGTFGCEEFPRSSLLGDLRSWIGNPVFSDVLLVITDETTKALRKVPAHKLLLSRCAYFAAMFSDLPLHEKT